jgi:hypothetical protein
MMDPTEIAEAVIERWAEENMRDDQFRCSCGVWIPIDGGFYMSGNPYAPPVCMECARTPLQPLQGEK